MKLKCLFLLALSSICTTSLFAQQEVSSERTRSFYDPMFRATRGAEEHFAMGMRAMHQKDWQRALLQFRTVICSFPYSCEASDAMFYSGVAYFHMGDYEYANRQFCYYLKEESLPKYFEEVFCYKFAIAEAFRKGSGKHIFGIEQFPKWIPATAEAIEIYDEIATTLPNDELAPRSLYAKGLLLREMKDYKGSIDTIQTLIRRYPKDALSAAGYLLIATDYYYLGRCELNNPDFLALALINIRRFGQDFPGDNRVNEALRIYCEMEEFYACGLFEMGRFFERTEHFNAATIYFIKTIKEFPDTKAANEAGAHLKCLQSRCSKEA